MELSNEQYGQHFMMNDEILKKTISFGKIIASDIILEIGTGEGALTKKLVKTKAKNIISVEKDEHLEPNIKNTKLELINEDILNNIQDLKFNKIISNIPYHISEPLFKKIFCLEQIPDIIVIVCGSKFKNIITSNSKRLGIITQSFFKITHTEEVPKTAFNPMPRVNSSLVVLEKKKNPNKIEILIQRIAINWNFKIASNLIKSCNEIFTKRVIRNNILSELEDEIKENKPYLIEDEEFQRLVKLLNKLL